MASTAVYEKDLAAAGSPLGSLPFELAVSFGLTAVFVYWQTVVGRSNNRPSSSTPRSGSPIRIQKSQSLLHRWLLATQVVLVPSPESLRKLVQDPRMEVLELSSSVGLSVGAATTTATRTSDSNRTQASQIPLQALEVNILGGLTLFMAAVIRLVVWLYHAVTIKMISSQGSADMPLCEELWLEVQGQARPLGYLSWLVIIMMAMGWLTLARRMQELTTTPGLRVGAGATPRVIAHASMTFGIVWMWLRRATLSQNYPDGHSSGTGLLADALFDVTVRLEVWFQLFGIRKTDDVLSATIRPYLKEAVIFLVSAASALLVARIAEPIQILQSALGETCFVGSLHHRLVPTSRGTVNRARYLHLLALLVLGFPGILALPLKFSGPGTVWETLFVLWSLSLFWIVPHLVQNYLLSAFPASMGTLVHLQQQQQQLQSGGGGSSSDIVEESVRQEAADLVSHHFQSRPVYGVRRAGHMALVPLVLVLLASSKVLLWPASQSSFGPSVLPYVPTAYHVRVAWNEYAAALMEENQFRVAQQALTWGHQQFQHQTTGCGDKWHASHFPNRTFTTLAESANTNLPWDEILTGQMLQPDQTFLELVRQVQMYARMSKHDALVREALRSRTDKELSANNQYLVVRQTLAKLQFVVSLLFHHLLLSRGVWSSLWYFVVSVIAIYWTLTALLLVTWPGTIQDWKRTESYVVQLQGKLEQKQSKAQLGNAAGNRSS